MASLRHRCKFQRVSRLGNVAARHFSSGRQPNFAALNRGCHLYSAGRPSRWALAHILVRFDFQIHYRHFFLLHFSFNWTTVLIHFFRGLVIGLVGLRLGFGIRLVLQFRVSFYVYSLDTQVAPACGKISRATWCISSMCIDRVK